MAMLGVMGAAGGLLSAGTLLKVGFMVASAIGLYLLNGMKEKGEVGRLDDLKVSSSSYGRGIPIVYGTMRVAGNMFWATDFEETVRYLDSKGKDIGEKKGQKKGEKKGTPHFEYHANFAMSLCEGPVEALLRIWADSNLIYDKHNPDNPDLVGPGFSQGEGGGGKSGFGLAKKKGADGGDSGRFSFRYYPGSESQLQDPFMVSKQGADMVPAHRGMCYLFFQRFALADFGNRVPTITAEVATRKKQEVTFRVLENMENAEDYFVPGSDATLVDPERFKLYQEEIDSNTGGRVLRIYDMSSEREVRRVPLSEINEINWPEGGHSIAEVIGLAGTGDIVCRVNPSYNSSIIGFFDPNTFILKADLFGTPGPSLSNGPNRIISARRATPCSYVSWEVGIDPDTLQKEVEITGKRCTLVYSYGNSYYIFGEHHEPLTYFDCPGGFTSNTIQEVVTKADLFSGQFYFITNINTNDNSKMYRVDWKMNATMNDEGTAYDIDISSSSDAFVKLIRELDSPNFQFVNITHAQLLSGAERVGWLERYDVADPDKRGLWAVAVSVLDPDANIIWEHKINSDPNSGPSGSGASNTLPPMPINTSSMMKWLDGGTVWTVDFRTEEAYFYSTGSQITTYRNGARQLYWPSRGAILIFINDPSDGGERKWCLGLVDRNSQVPVDIHFIMSDLAERVGLPASKVDLTMLAPQEITGYIIENPSSARKVIEQLSQLFMFDAVESDYRLKVVSRGQDSIVTIPQKDLGIIDAETQDHFIETRVQEIDIPQTVVVSYINPEHDYNTNTQHYRRPRSPMPVMHSRDKLEINLPMALSPDQAKQLAHKVSKALWTERINYDIILPWKYLVYDPTDVIRFVMDTGLEFEVRMMKMDVGANFTIDTTGVTQTPAAYYSEATAGPIGGVIPIPQPWPPHTDGLAFNVPYLEDADDVGFSQWSYYYGAAAYGPGLKGAVVQYKLAGLGWNPVGLVTQELVWGFVQGIVPPPANGPFATDDQTVITLSPAHPYEDESGFMYGWESIPESQWPSDRNMIIIGNEIILFRDTEILPSGLIKISHLIRGERGTETDAYTHSPYEKFCVVTDGLRQRTEDFTRINQLYKFRSFSRYSVFPPSATEVFMDGSSHKPWAPNYFKRHMSGSNLIISWQRRTRFGGGLKNGTGDIPLNEESQRYDLFILDAPYDPEIFDPENPSTYVRSFLNLTTTQASYTSALRSADGYNVADPLYVVCFQRSVQVGRGFPGYDTLYPSILIEV